MVLTLTALSYTLNHLQRLFWSLTFSSSTVRHPQALPSISNPIAVSNIAMGLANLRYSPGTPLLLELQSASMRVMVPKVRS